MHSLLRPLPVPDAAHLVSVFTTPLGAPNEKTPLSLAMFDQLRRQTSVFSHLSAWAVHSTALRNLEANGIRYSGSMTEVTGDYLSALGAKSLLGRLIGPADVGLFAGASAPVVVLDYRCWQRMYGADPHVLGRTIRVDGVPLTIVGVTAREFGGLDVDHAPDLVAPLGYDGVYDFRRPQALTLYLAGQLAPGIKPERARAQLAALWPHILEAAAPPGMEPARRTQFFGRGVGIESLSDGLSYLRLSFLEPLSVLMGLVGLVLLIACVNLANLLLARAAGRRHELGIRAAFGSGRWRLLRPLLLESLLIALSGALLGLTLAFRAGPFLLRSVYTGWVPMTVETTPDLRVTLFATVIALLTGALAGVAPAVGVLRTDPVGALRQQARTVHGAGGRLAKLLIVGQAALALVLVAGAILFARTLQNLRETDPGFPRGRILILQLFPQTAHGKVPNRAAYYRELSDTLMQVAGVRAVTYSNSAPVAPFDWEQTVSTPSSSSPMNAFRDLVGPEFFRAMGVRVISGRDFDWSDNESSPPAAIISEKLARHLFPGEDPLNRTIDIGREVPVHARIVGVVTDASLEYPRRPHAATVYTFFLRDPEGNDFNLDIHTAGDPHILIRPAERVVASLGRHFSLRSETADEKLDRVLARERVVAMLSVFFGCTALLLGAIGLYGVLSYSVVRRTGEIGVRMALGAGQGNIFAMVLGQMSFSVGCGLAIGAALVAAGSRLASALLFGVTGNDPLIIAAAATILLLVGALAASIPAVRAARTDPMDALRSE